MIKVDRELLLPNPYRDFIINPISEHQVKELIKSYRKNGDFGVIPVRKAKDGEKYEIACGHHRLSAMAEIGFHKIDCKLGQFSDDEMISLMVSENASQHGGKPSSQADSVAAAIRRVAFWILASENLEQFNEMATAAKSYGEISPYDCYFTTNSQFAKAKAELTDGGVLGRRTVAKYLGDALSEDAIREALASLLISGGLENAIKHATESSKIHTDMKRAEVEAEEAAQIEKARKEEEADRREQEKLRKAIENAEKKRIEAERAAKEAKAQEEKAKQSRIMREQQRKKEAAEKERREAEARERVRAEEKKRLEEERERREAMERKRAAEREAALAAAHKREVEAIIDPDALAMLQNAGQSKMFRTMVAKNKDLYGRDVFDQKGFIERIAAQYRDAIKGGKRKDDEAVEDTEFLTAEIIRQEMELIDLKRQKELKRIEEERQRRLEMNNKDAKVRRVMDDLQHKSGELANVLRDVDAILADPESADIFYQKSHGVNMSRYITTVEEVCASIREKLKIHKTAFYTSKTIDTTIVN